MKFYIRTLGCKMNWLDSARLSGVLQGAGHIRTQDESEADYVFVNTCTVTAEADRKSRQSVSAAGRRQKQVAVMGCGPRVQESGWGEEASDTLVFTSEEHMLDHFGVSDEPVRLCTDSRTRLPVAIQTGCDNLCTFCITRIARGRHRNISADLIVEQVRQAEELGIREVVLTGINLAAWGCEDTTRPQQAQLHVLLEQILAATREMRVRLSSLGPQFIQPGFFDVFTDERICDYLHLSIQSGSPAVLERMIRGHGMDEVYRIVEQARAARPDTAINTDLIAGFPGEGEREFAETVAMVERIGFAKLHVFPYSSREGTEAALFAEQVPMQERKRRAAILRDLGKQTRKAFLQSQLGKSKKILVESGNSGLSGNYIRARVDEPFDCRGQFSEVKLSRENMQEA